MNRFLLILIFLIPLLSLSQRFYLKIQAKDSVEQMVVDSLLVASKYNSVQEIDRKIKSLEQYFIDNGFFRLKSNILKINDSVFNLNLDLGKKIRQIKLLYQDAETLILKDNKFVIKEYVKTNEVADYLEKIKNTLSNKGYVFSKTYLTKFIEKDDILEAELIIELNQKRVIDEVVVKGYDQFPFGLTKTLNRKWKGKLLNSENVEEIEKDFMTIPFVNKIKATEVLTTVDSTKVFAYFKKVRNNFFDGFIGIRNSEITNRTQLYGSVDVSLFNNLNYGEKIRFNWRNDGNDQSVLNVNTEFNYIFKSRLAQRNELQIFRQDSTFQNTKFKFQLGYLFSFRTKLFLGIQSNTSVSNKNLTNAQLENFDNVFYNLSYNYEMLNSNLDFFRENFRLNFETGLGSRKGKTKTINQSYAQLLVEKNFKLNERNYFLIRTENYYLNSNDYLVNELYRFGGINSIRGFRENSLLGNLLVSFSSEYRFLGSENLCFHTVIDAGYLENLSQNIKNKLYSFGLGLIIKRQNSMFNFLFSNGLTNENINFSLRNSLIQVKVVSFF